MYILYKVHRSTYTTAQYTHFDSTMTGRRVDYIPGTVLHFMRFTVFRYFPPIHHFTALLCSIRVLFL